MERFNARNVWVVTSPKERRVEGPDPPLLLQESTTLVQTRTQERKVSSV